MNELKAFTITNDLARPSLLKVKKCYVMRHANVKELFWNTKIEVRITLADSTIEDVIEMFEDQWKVPYIQNINKGDIISQKQINAITSFHAVHSIKTYQGV